MPRVVDYDQQLSEMDFNDWDNWGWCRGYSWFHDLKCGHRVKAPSKDPCGTNCHNRPRATGAPFVCQQCIRDEVEIELKMGNFKLDNDEKVNLAGNTEISLADKVGILADRKVKIAMKAVVINMAQMKFDIKFRMSVPALKLESPMEMMYHSIELEEEEKDRAAGNLAAKRTGPLHRPTQLTRNLAAAKKPSGVRKAKKAKKTGGGLSNMLGILNEFRHMAKGAKQPTTKEKAKEDLLESSLAEAKAEVRVEAQAKVEAEAEMNVEDEISKAVREALEKMDLN
jgi:hypothetical protein